jgi:hypothetical protein
MRAVLFLAIGLSPLVRCAPEAGTVDADSLPVYSKASATSPVRSTLKRGDTVTINMVLQTNRGNWCDISGSPDVSGYVECDRLKQGSVQEILTKAGAKPPDSDALLNEALRLSGFTQEAAAMSDPALVNRINDAVSDARLTKQQSADVVRILQQVFTSEKLMASVRVRLKTGHSAEQLFALLDQLQTPVARRMTQLEVQAQPPTLDPRAIQSFASQLSTAPPPRARLDLIARVNQAQRVLSSSLDQIAALLHGMMLGWNLSPQEIEIEMRRARSAMPPDLGDVIQAQETLLSLYAYRSVSDGGLVEYADLLESKPVQWFYRDLHQGVLDFVQQAGSDLVTLGHIPRPSR